ARRPGRRRAVAPSPAPGGSSKRQSARSGGRWVLSRCASTGCSVATSTARGGWASGCAAEYRVTTGRGYLRHADADVRVEGLEISPDGISALIGLPRVPDRG